MGMTLTITNVEEIVAQKLRTRAASCGRTVEAEARAILSEAVATAPRSTLTESGKIPANVCDPVRGLWIGRGSTDELMRTTRGED